MARLCTQWKDHGEFVEHDCGIFDKHGVWKTWFGGQRVDMDAELGEEMFIGSVLCLGFNDVDRLAIDEGEFAIGKGRADGARDGMKHRESLAGAVTDGEKPDGRKRFAARFTSCGP